MVKSDIFEKAKKFVYRNARPLELALWKYHFENGSKNDVLTVLSAYQNEDGGFAYALEPDSWNVNSTPICTWYATRILDQIDFNDTSHPIFSGIFKYLASGKDFSDGKWFNTVPTNNDYPHAIWWECKNDKGEPFDNPTVSLAGFIIRYGDKTGKIYSLACKIIKNSVDGFMKKPETEMHLLNCYINLLNYCEQAKDFDLFDIKLFKEKLIKDVNAAICADTEKWTTDYVCRPSHFFDRRLTVFKEINRKLTEYEGEVILNSQLDNGAFPVTWQWHTDYSEFEISRNWWQSVYAIKNMLYLKELNKI